MIYARIDDGTIVERRSMDLSQTPLHKAAMWLPVEDVAPSYNGAIQAMSRSEVIEPTRVLAVYTVARLPLDQQKNAVKAEAQRRILALMGTADIIKAMIKQSNANMRANELNDKRINGGTLTTDEEAEAVALRGLADKIKSTRDASNWIEAMAEIPLDYASDRYWPS